MLFPFAAVVSCIHQPGTWLRVAKQVNGKRFNRTLVRTGVWRGFWNRPRAFKTAEISRKSWKKALLKPVPNSGMHQTLVEKISDVMSPLASQDGHRHRNHPKKAHKSLTPGHPTGRLPPHPPDETSPPHQTVTGQKIFMFMLGAKKSTQTFFVQSFSKPLRVMDVRAENRGRPHQKVRFPAAPVVGRNFLTLGIRA